MRLIDADTLEKDLKESYKALAEFHKGLTFDEERRVCEGRLATFRECAVRIHKAPTVDIKTEVARQIFAEIEKLISAKTHSYVLCGSHSHKAIDYGRQCTLREINAELAELKNKYIGGVGE
jgi:hypothetical protein